MENTKDWTNMYLQMKRLDLPFAIRNQGYYRFTKDFITYEADTANAKEYQHESKPFFKRQEQGEPRAKIYVEIKPFSKEKIEHPFYTIQDAFIRMKRVGKKVITFSR